MSTRTRVLGSTRIVEPLAKGGMAEVYRGVQTALGREVAVKVMLPDIARDREMKRRFRREARVLATLSHQNIVAIHDLVEKNRQIFIVMELIDGVDVQGLLRSGGALPLDVALIIATSVARALEHAHFHKVIHRDIKPANVLISRAGTAKLTDFGVAKDLTAQDITQAGFVVGTPAFLAPELLSGQPADARSDFYALGALLYNLIAGRRPFTGKSSPKLFRAILAGERERLRSLVSDCPRGVEKIVDRCLSTDPESRYARTSELRKALEDQLDRVFDGNAEARLASFLYERGHAHAEHLATVNLDELSIFDPSIPVSVGSVVAARKELVGDEDDSHREEVDTDDEDDDETGAISLGGRLLRAAFYLLVMTALAAAAAVYFMRERVEVFTGPLPF